MPFFAAADRPRQARPGRAMPRRAGVLGARLAGWRGAAAALGLACSTLTMLTAPAAQAQQPSGGQIYIPGPGERGAAQSNAAADAAGGASNGIITIPGPGEQPAGRTAAAAPSGIITIPGPGERGAQAAGGAFGRGRQAGPKAAAASSDVVPVVVTPAPRTARAAQPIALDRPAGAGGSTLDTPVAPAKPVAAVKPIQVAAARPVAAAGGDASGPQAQAPTGNQDGESIRRVALAYLQQQSAGLPGKVTITVAPAFPRGLAACTTLVPFMPPGARLWGRTSVGVRCAGERPWTLYLQARVSLEASYYLAAHQIEPGTVLTAADLTTRDGDLANLPRTIVTDASQGRGRGGARPHQRRLAAAPGHAAQRLVGHDRPDRQGRRRRPGIHDFVGGQRHE